MLAIRVRPVSRTACRGDESQRSASPAQSRGHRSVTAAEQRLGRSASANPLGQRSPFPSECGINPRAGQHTAIGPQGRFEFRRSARPVQHRQRSARPSHSRRSARRHACVQRPAYAAAGTRLPQPSHRSARLPPHAARAPPDEFPGADAIAGAAVFRRARLHRRAAGRRDALRHQRDGVPCRLGRAACRRSKPSCAGTA